MTLQFIKAFKVGVQFAIAALEYRTPKSEICSEAQRLLDRLGEQGASDKQFAQAVDDYAMGRDVNAPEGA